MVILKVNKTRIWNVIHAERKATDPQNVIKILVVEDGVVTVNQLHIQMKRAMEYMDLSKAFDSLNHELLVANL